MSDDAIRCLRCDKRVNKDEFFTSECAPDFDYLQTPKVLGVSGIKEVLQKQYPKKIGHFRFYVVKDAVHE